jgi:hypothetical protein
MSTTGATLDLSNKSLTDFDLEDAFLASMGTLPNIKSGSSIYINGNQIPADGVIKFFEDAYDGVVVEFSSSCVFDAHGPDMGCPLTGGTAGGWSVDFTAYPTGNDESFTFDSVYYQPSDSINLASLVNFADSSYSVGAPPFYNEITIGVQDSPTIAQIVAKIAEFYPLIRSGGTTFVSGNSVTFIDSTPREWVGSTSTYVTVSMLGGTDPENATIENLQALSNNGSFTGPDGVTQINF